MSTNTNGIATQANLYSLNSGAFPNWSGSLKCPTKGEILSGANSNYTVTIANNNNYSDKQLVKYSDITVIGNTTQDIVLTTSVKVSFIPTHGVGDKLASAEFIITEIGETLSQTIACYNDVSNIAIITNHTLSLKKNAAYEFYFKKLSEYAEGSFNIGGITGELGGAKIGPIIFNTDLGL